MEQNVHISSNVAAIVCKTLTLETIASEKNLIESGLLDSLSLVQLMVELEDEFKIKIEPDEFDFEDYQSVRSISEMIIRFSQLNPSTVRIN